MSLTYLHRMAAQHGVSNCADAALAGRPLTAEEIRELLRAPLPLVALVADAMRAAGDAGPVRILDGQAQVNEASLAVVDTHRDSGPELMQRVAIARLSAGSSASVAVRLGGNLDDALMALAFGADAIALADSPVRRLPLADGAADGRARLEDEVRRTGRDLLWVEAVDPRMEQRS